MSTNTNKWVDFFTEAGLPTKVATKYATIFTDHRIQFDMLTDLTKDILYDMGIQTVGDVIAILKHAKSVQDEKMVKKSNYEAGTTSNKLVTQPKPATRNLFPTETADRSKISPQKSGKSFTHSTSSDSAGQEKSKMSTAALKEALEVVETFAAASLLCGETTNLTLKIIILTEIPSQFEFDCENAAIFVSQNAIDKISGKPGDWVSICLQNKTTTESKSRFARVFPVPTDDDQVAYISPQLWLNLQQFASSSSGNRPLLRPDVNIIVRRSLNNINLNHVKAAHISLINSPDYSANDDFSGLLQKYFSIERYIQSLDVIGIPTTEDLLYNSKKDNLMSPNRVVYFRVSLIEGNGCLLDVNHSSKLYQTGTVHSFIPATLQSYYYNHLFLFEQSLVGLEKYTRQLCKLIYPYQNPNNNIPATIMIHGPSGSGKRSVVRSTCKYWNLNIYEINSNQVFGDSPVSTEAKLKNALAKAAVYSPCIMLISNINLLFNNEDDESRLVNLLDNSLKELRELDEKWPIITIATNSGHEKSINKDLTTLFLHNLYISSPLAEEREEIIKGCFGKLNISSDVNFKELAKKTSGFNYGDLCAFVAESSRNLYYKLCSELNLNSINNLSDIAIPEITMPNQILKEVLDEMQHSHADAIGAPKIPNVHWDDIGGLEDVKSEILSTIKLPYEFPQLIASGLRRTGVLLHGPPGTGKTLLAKAVATQCGLNFLSVKGPELINMYVGQSEENVREVFQRARNASPCIIFFDELDSLAPNRGRSGDSGGVMDRVVSQLLAEMDGLDKSKHVFIIGATNRPDLLDPALLRPGRFDKLLYVGISEDSNSRLKILKALTRKFDLADDVDLNLIESQCPRGMSGADFYSLCSNAMMNAVERCINMVDAGEIREEDCRINVCLSDFFKNMENVDAKYVNK